jgi:glyoxylase-like metal-dependent hydrolase (beta-lactamase superfamily II)
MKEAKSITVQEFKNRLEAGEVECIFDLRNIDEFESWKIEGRTGVETINIPQIHFLGEEEKYLPQLPKDKEIVTVCAHGGASKYTADLLVENGFRSVNLKGGMDAWSDFYEIHEINDDPRIYQMYRVAKGCITYVLISEGEAIVIDAVRRIDKIISLVKSHDAKVVSVCDTHLQADHISGGPELARRYKADYLIHPDDAVDAYYNYTPLSDGKKISYGKNTIEAIHSPGHTAGLVSLLLENRYLFVGDTIMKASFGRPDLGGMVDEWGHFLFDTIFKRYGNLSDEVVVLPSHSASIMEEDENGGVKMTLGQARDKAEALKITDEKSFMKYIKGSMLNNPPRYQEIRKVNLGQLIPDEAKIKELEIGKNLCGMKDGKKPGDKSESPAQ